MSQTEDEEYEDVVFSQLAAKLGGVKPLLSSLFGFLHRRTDFYVEFDPATSPKASMGFPRGVANKLVQDAFQQFPFKRYEEPALPQSLSPALQSAASATAVQTKTPLPKPPAATSLSTASLAKDLPPLLEGQQPMPIGNGGVGPNYYWTQTLHDLTMYVDVATGTRGKDVRCEIKAKTLFLAVGEVLIEGEFEDPVRQDESMWTINISSSGTQPPQVVITLDKTRKTWWKHALVGHPEIDTTKVDSTQKMGEYDEATQAAIRKIMFEESEKRKAKEK